MTTEASPGVEVNDSEKPENKSEPSGDSNEEAQHAEGNPNGASDCSENANPAVAEQANAIVEASSPSSPTEKSPAKLRKETHESKGISRFLPPWLKKQKSLSQSDSLEENKDNVAQASDVGQVTDEQVNGHDEKLEEENGVANINGTEEKDEPCNVKVCIMCSLPAVHLFNVHLSTK